jgi:integrase
MARPPTPVGTWGKISEPRDVSGGVEVHARIRMGDGRSKQVRAWGRAGNAARTRLREKLGRLAKEAVGGDIGRDTRFGAIADMWIDDLAEGYRLRGKPSTTPRTYQSYIDNWVKPALGELQAREVRAKQVDGLIKRGREKSYATAKSLKSVLSGICGYAVRHGAMDANWARSAERLEGEAREVKALTLEQRCELHELLVDYGTSRQVDKRGRRLGERGRIWLELPDIQEAMLATGVRLGELLALDGDHIDPAARTVRIAYHLVREPKVGLIRVDLRKGNAQGLLLRVPEWSVPMWRARKLASGGGPVFPGPSGWRAPDNVISSIKQAMTDVGYDWVTSHVWRKTVATVLDEADLPTTAIADQLGNTPKVIERHYRRKRESDPATAAALESIRAVSVQ